MIAEPILTVAGLDVLPPVVKVDTTFEISGLPANVLAPVVTVTVYADKARKTSVGVNVAVVPAYVTTPGTTVVLCVTIMVDELIVAGSIATLKEMIIELFRGTAVALLAGVVAVTVGVTAGTLLESLLQLEINRMKANDKS